MEEIVKKRMISLPEVREILSEGNPESLDQIQRWTFDYVSKFAKIEPKAAKKMKLALINQCDLTEEEAVEIVNILPKSLPELRSFTFGWKKLILSETLKKILKIVDDNS